MLIMTFYKPSQGTIIYLKLKYPQKSLTTMLSGTDLHKVDRTEPPHSIRTLNYEHKNFKAKNVYNNLLYDTDDIDTYYDENGDLTYRDPGAIVDDNPINPINPTPLPPPIPTIDPVKGIPNEEDDRDMINIGNRLHGYNNKIRNNNNNNRNRQTIYDDSSPVFYDEEDKKKLFNEDFTYNDDQTMYYGKKSKFKIASNKKKKKNQAMKSKYEYENRLEIKNSNRSPVTFLNPGKKRHQMDNRNYEIPENHRPNFVDDYYQQEYDYPNYY